MAESRRLKVYIGTPTEAAEAGSGEVNTASNSGAGEGLVLTKSGSDLPFKTLIAGDNITFTVGTESITVNAANSSSLVIDSKDSNVLDFRNALGRYFGTHDAPRTGTLTTDITGALATSIAVYYQHTELDIDIDFEYSKGLPYVANKKSKLYIERDLAGVYSLNILPISTVYYSLSFSTASRLQGVISNASGLGVGEYMAIRVKFDNVSDTQILFGDALLQNTYQLLLTNTIFRGLVDGGSGVNATHSMVAGQFYDIKITNNGVNADVSVDNTIIGQTNSSADLIASVFDQIGRRGTLSDASNTPSYWLDGEVEWIDMNGSLIKFTDKSGVHTSEDEARSLTIVSHNSTPLNDLYNELV